MSGSIVLGFIVAVLIIGAVADIDNTLIGFVAGSALTIYLFGWRGALVVALISICAWAASRAPALPQKPKSSRKTYWLLLRLPFSDD